MWPESKFRDIFEDLGLSGEGAEPTPAPRLLGQQSSWQPTDMELPSY